MLQTRRCSVAVLGGSGLIGKGGQKEVPLVFAYGTLMRCGWNHDHFLAGAEFLGTAKTINRYALMISPETLLPFLTEKPAVHVSGEVYLVRDSDLRAIDWLETSAGYLPSRIDVELIGSGSVVSCVAYTWEGDTAGFIDVPTGDWFDVVSTGGR